MQLINFGAIIPINTSRVQITIRTLRSNNLIKPTESLENVSARSK